MWGFIKQVLLFSSFVLGFLLVLGGLYIYLDPFKVVKTYAVYYDENAKGWAELNKDYVSTMTYRQQVDKEHYNAFIFGNSRSIYYRVADWRRHLGPKASCYHFDASGESLWAMEKKLAYIDQQGGTLSDVLLVLDAAILEQVTPKSGHLFMISPALVNHSNRVGFHTTAFLTFIRPQFLVAYLDFKRSGRVKPYMKKKYLLDDRPFTYDVRSNELRYDHFEQLIAENRYFTPERMAAFYDRSAGKTAQAEPCILDEQKRLLTNIQALVHKHGTNIKLIISPLYDQIPFNPTDLNYLKTLFGEANVFDFSGINRFTADYTHYYEASHYRPHVANALMDSVYAASTTD